MKFEWMTPSVGRFVRSRFSLCVALLMCSSRLTAQTSDRVGLGRRACDGNPVTVGAGGLHDLRDQLEANTVENTAKVSASVVIAKTRKPGLHEEDPGAGGPRFDN